jgi:hypothetical protein
MKRAFLVRHGHVDKENRNFDTLNVNGIALSKELPSIISSYGAKLSKAYYENNNNDRCRNTIDKFECEKIAFGDRAGLRSINEALKDGTDDFVICYRAPNIECGALYHVHDLEIHTNYSEEPYKTKARDKMQSAYEFIYVLEFKDGIWRQVDKIETGYDYNGKK